MFRASLKPPYSAAVHHGPIQPSSFCCDTTALFAAGGLLTILARFAVATVAAIGIIRVITSTILCIADIGI